MQQKSASEKIGAGDLRAAREDTQVKTLRQNSAEQNELLIFQRRKSVTSFEHSVIAC